MSIKKIIFSFIFTFMSSSAFAGAGHNHSHDHAHINQNQAEAVATKNVSVLVKKGRIAESWTPIKANKVEQKKFGQKLEWVVSFKNDKIKEPAKQTLYIFLTLAGEYLAANYTGK